MREYKENPWKMTKSTLFFHIRHLLHMHDYTANGWFHGDRTGSDLVECVITHRSSNTAHVDTGICAIVREFHETYCPDADSNVLSEFFTLREVGFSDYIEDLLNKLADFDSEWLFADEGGRIYFNIGKCI